METLIVENIYELERNKPMPSKKHSFAQTRLIIAFAKKYEQEYDIFSELTLRLPNALQDYVPDLTIYEIGTISQTEEEVQVTTVPLCAVEIMSPSQTLEELVGKIHQYFALGIKSAWLVLPTLKNVYVYTAPHEYEIYRKKDILKDTFLNVEIDLKNIFN